MKVICIHEYYDAYTSIPLVKDKLYNVIGKYDHRYAISDGINSWWYPKSLFKPLSEIRDKTINRLLDL